jgi:long-chain acyl-CoA synthetase
MAGTAVTPFSSQKVSHKNVAFLELDNLNRFGEYTRLLFQDTSSTNAAELRYAGRIAHLLKDRGVRAGDRVLTVLPNTPELTASFQATWSLGAVIVPITPLWAITELAHAIADSGASVVLTCPPFASLVREASQLVSNYRLLSFGSTDVAGFDNIAGELTDCPSIETPVDRSATDIAILLYTSGTTAKPKGVVVTHGNVAAAMESVKAVNPVLQHLPMLHALPLTHIFGILVLQLSNYWGLQSVLIRQFDPLMVYQAIQRYGVGYLLAVPTMLLYLLHHPDRTLYNLSSLKRVISGGANLPEPLRLGFESAFHCHVEQGYGMSETGFCACYAEGDPYRINSVGRPCPGFEVCIADELDQSLPARSVGEICMISPSVTPGYWNDPESTRGAFTNGWFRSGDVGYQDEDGFLYITDRKKDLIIKGGENLSPREIEEALFAHHAIAEAAVVGVPDPIFGEAVCAVVQLRSGAMAGEEEIRQHVAQRLGRFKAPSQVVFQSALPRNYTGKIDKRTIRSQLAMRNVA